MDSVEVSLLTCEPGTETWSQYGHTAVRWHDKQRGGMDVAINYGVFTPDAPYFVLRFILGLTDYQLGVVPFELFCAQYEYEKRAVCEQVLDLDNADKEAIFSALQVNMRPENVVYRYNYFYDNCTTRARDLLVSHLHGQVSYPAARPAGDDSFRRMIHEWNAQTPWTQTGEDILLGVKADGATTKAQQQFLPDHLRSDFARATYRGKPLVRETRDVIRVVRDETTPAFSLTPMALALGLLVLSLIVWAVEWRKQRIFWGWDLLLMVPAGCVGLILTMMIFSQHPCVSLNLLILIFNPLPLPHGLPRDATHDPPRGRPMVDDMGRDDRFRPFWQSFPILPTRYGRCGTHFAMQLCHPPPPQEAYSRRGPSSERKWIR